MKLIIQIIVTVVGLGYLNLYFSDDRSIWLDSWVGEACLYLAFLFVGSGLVAIWLDYILPKIKKHRNN